MKRARVSVTRRSVFEFAFGRLGVTTAHASRLAQLEFRVLVGAGGSVGALIGQSACRLLAFAREATESTRAGAATRASLPGTPRQVPSLEERTDLFDEGHHI